MTPVLSLRPGRAKRFAAVGVLAVVLAGCSLAPDQAMPAAATAAAYKAADKDAETAAPIDLQVQWQEATPAADMPRGAWWQAFADEELTALILRATTNNQNLAQMLARVEQARQTAVMEGAPLFPSVTADAAALRQKPSAAGTGFNASFPPQDVFRAGLGLTYELDLFGKLRNARAAARLDTAAAAAEFNSMLLALQADVAQLYFTLRGQDAELVLLEETLKLRQDSVRILESRREVGVVTDLDVAQNIVDLENTRAALQQLRAERQQNENALAVLLGLPPSDLQLPARGITGRPPAVPAGLPADMLQRRPDIAAAQHSLMAANARIGVARAAFFPTLSLTGSAGYASDSLGNLFNWSSRTWALGPLMTLPVFEGGRIVANNARVRARYEEAVAMYRQTVLVAFRDVEDILVRMRMRREQEKSFTTARTAAVRAAKLATARYESGDSDYLEEITARQSALAAGRALIQNQTGQFIDAVQLIRALGGDYTSGMPRPADR